MSKYYIYKFLNKDNEVIYIGRTKNIERRINQHFKNGHLNKKCYKETLNIEFTELEYEGDMHIYEIYLICKYKPKYNTVFNGIGINIKLKEPRFKPYKKEKYNVTKTKSKKYKPKHVKIKFQNGNILLTNRDFKIINYINLNKYTPTNELLKKFFPNSGLRTCQARLKLLVDAELISCKREDILCPKTYYLTELNSNKLRYYKGEIENETREKVTKSP